MAGRFIKKKKEARKGKYISEKDQRLSQKTIMIPKAAGCGQHNIYLYVDVKILSAIIL